MLLRYCIAADGIQLWGANVQWAGNFKKEERMDISFHELYQQAKSVLNPRRLSKHAEAGGVVVRLRSLLPYDHKQPAE
jgi:hypothetical protein